VELLVGEVETDVARGTVGLLERDVGLEVVVQVEPEAEEDHPPLLTLG